MKSIQKLQDDVKQWSDNTFGEHRTGLPIAHHLKKEIDEVIDAIKVRQEGWKYHPKSGKLSSVTANMLQRERDRVKYELADCLMLLIDSAAHEGILMTELIDASFDKLEINKTREWGKPDENGVIEHIHKE